MLKYEQEFAKKVFEGPTHKQAYKKAIKWLAQYVIGEDELKDTEVQFIKGYTRSQLPTITVRLSVGLSEEELRERHCKICKEFHGLFFINQDVNCAWCNTKGYQNRADEMIKGKVSHYKSVLKEKMKCEQ